MQVREVMSKNVVTATPQTPISQVGRPPVAGRGRIVGLLSAGEWSRELQRALDGLLAAWRPGRGK